MFPLHTETPEEGQTLEQLFQISSSQVRAMLANMKETARGLGLEYGDRTRTFNSRRAQELGLWAAEQGCGEAFDMAMFHAYFVIGVNIALPEVLMRIVSEVGLGTEEAQKVLELGLYADAVDKEWHDTRHVGVRAIPTFCMGDTQLVGAQSYEALEELVQTHGVARRQDGKPLPLFR